MAITTNALQTLRRSQRVFGFDVPNWVLAIGLGGAAWFVLARARRAFGKPNFPSGTPASIADYLTSAKLPEVDYLYMDLIYPPHSAKAVELFTFAAKQAGLPASWGASKGLHSILAKESGGYVGRPNYQFGDLANVKNQAHWPRVWKAIVDGDAAWRAALAEPYRSQARGTQSSATGLGQLTSTNIRTGKYYPSGVRGIGNPLEEAIGMLRYIKDRYGDPENAWAKYGKGQEGY